jgi:hypothetical protein
MPRRYQIELISLDKTQHHNHPPGQGWPDEAESLTVGGLVRQITIRDTNGESIVSIRIRDDGELILSDLGNLCYSIDVTNPLYLRPSHPLES